MLGGVAAGLADYAGIDPIVVRAAFVVLTFLGGVGIFLYLLGWLMIPPAPSPISVRERLPARTLGWVRGRPAWVGIILLVIGSILVAERLGVWHPTVFWGVTLVVVGIALFREDRGWRNGTPVGGSEPDPPPLPVPDVAPSEVDLTGGTSPGLADPSDQDARSLRSSGWTPRWPFRPRLAAPSPPPRIPRERSPLGWLAMGIALLALGGAAALSEWGAIRLELSQFLAMVLAILGAGLLVGTWRGRARWLILPGILLLPLVLGASLIDVPITGGFGNRYISPLSVAEIHRTYQLSAGDLVLDLTSLRFGPGDVTIDATVAAGRISVVVPEGISIEVRAHPGAGRVALFGQADQGIRIDVARTSTTPGSLENLILNLRTGVGEVVVYRVFGAGG
jgi:phage shock protein PspC (stress-responsive transcriptional regulator)